MSDDLLHELVMGTLHKELSKAREEALLVGIGKGYTDFEWVVYSETPNIIDMFGRKKRVVTQDPGVIREHLARISYTADLRANRTMEHKVKVNYL